MTRPLIMGRYVAFIKHLAFTRALEVAALQASPIIGCVLGGAGVGQRDWLCLALLVVGSLLLTAHVFVFNDWAGHSSDMLDPRRAANTVFGKDEIARVAGALLLLSMAAFMPLGWPAVLLGASIAILSFLYSHSQAFGKSTPVAASFNHLLGGMLHFLLGYTAFHDLDMGGVACSVFFGLVFAAGHLNQEVRDHEGDLLNGIRTSAVVFGCRRAFLASLVIFTAAYALLIALAAFNILPRVLLWSDLLWLLQVAWSAQALRRGLGFETAQWMQRRYRMLFAVIGLAMLVK